MEIDDMIEVLQAYKKGKQIQYRNTRLDGDWVDPETRSPVWQFYEFEYRVKPEPREWYMRVYQDNYDEIVLFSSKEALFDDIQSRNSVDKHPFDVIKVREVIE